MLAQKRTYIHKHKQVYIYIYTLERENYRNLERSSGEGRESLRLGPKPPFFMSDWFGSNYVFVEIIISKGEMLRFCYEYIYIDLIWTLMWSKVGV